MLNTVSLFSGCGGLDLGFENAGCNVVWGVDFDKFAVQTYNANFDTKIIQEDLNNVTPSDIPDHNMLIGGFPCQPFSMMGKKEGFQDQKGRGDMFFKIIEILRIKQPEVVVLENVKDLLTNDNGHTISVIKQLLTELGYKIHMQVLNTKNYGIPQTRNRVFIVCFKNHEIDFHFPEKVELKLTMQDLLETGVDEKYFLSERMVKTVMSWGTKNYSAKPEIDLQIARPLCATMAKMHRASQDNYVTENGRIRRLVPRECARLQGFPDSFVIPVSDTQAYRQFGNAVTVTVAEKVAQCVLRVIEKGV